MYCGDETGSYIGDVGSHTCRFGYGGEDNPKFVMPSYVCNKTHMAPSCLSERIANQELGSILRSPQYSSSDDNDNVVPLTDPNAFLRQGDIVDDWDNLQVAWHTSMDALHAKDTLKHTSGGTPYSTTINNSNNNTNSSTHQESSSTAAGGGGGGGDGKCVHPILAVTPGFTHMDGYGPRYCAAQRRQQLIQYTEMLMESLDASSLFLAPSSMLSAFSFGRQTALVVDVGAGGCRVTPVVEGLVLGQSQRRNGRGGDWLSHMTWKAMLEQTKVSSIKPRYQLRTQTKNKKKIQDDAMVELSTKPLFHKWAMQELMYGVLTDPDMQVSVSDYETDGLRVPFLDPFPSTSSSSAPSSPEHESSASSSTTSSSGNNNNNNNATPTNYQLPDGTNIDMSSPLAKDISRIPDLLFSDRLPFQNNTTSTSTTTTTNDIISQYSTFSNAPLHKLIRESLLAVGDVDARKELANCICLVGGASVLPNLDARLSAELSNILPQFVKPRVVASRQTVERSCASWIGGSILTSLGSFQQLWLGRTEYEEYGVTLSIQRFPG